MEGQQLEWTVDKDEKRKLGARSGREAQCADTLGGQHTGGAVVAKQGRVEGFRQVAREMLRKVRVALGEQQPDRWLVVGVAGAVVAKARLPRRRPGGGMSAGRLLVACIGRRMVGGGGGGGGGAGGLP